MTRHAKLIIAALATTLAATLGTAGVAATADAGAPFDNKVMLKDRGWCC